MNYSTNYILYPVNRNLERAIAASLHLLGEGAIDAATPDRSVTVADIFLFTRGNYEQHSFSTNILEDLQIALEKALSELEPQSQEWPETQNRLGNVYAAQAQQLHDVELFAKAIDCFNAALEVLTQETTPQQWAETQFNLATASQASGQLQEDGKLLNSAVEAYTQALLVWSREDDLEDWMLTMHQLGVTFHAYGKLLKGNRTFQKSVVAYKNALKALNADDYALELTATHSNRGAVLHHLGEAEENPERLEEAIKSYEKGLTVCMEQQLPFHLAVIIRVNKATAQYLLAKLKNDAVLAEEVADEFELMLMCFPHVLQPLCAKYCEEMAAKAKSLI